MISTEIQKHWVAEGQEVIVYSPDILAPLKLQKRTNVFLSTIGLPSEAAPFLSFSTNTHGEWNSIAHITEIDTVLDSSFADLIQIGSDGSGNAIVIDIGQSDFIKLLDHDNEFTLIFINSSIEAFAASLVAYSIFIGNVLSQGKEDSYFDTHFTNEQFATLKDTLISIDKYFDSSEFWQNELTMLLGNREAYRNESGD